MAETETYDAVAARLGKDEGRTLEDEKLGDAYVAILNRYEENMTAFTVEELMYLYDVKEWEAVILLRMGKEEYDDDPVT